jgi:Xaa-Pro aminopeptidase
MKEIIALQEQLKKNNIAYYIVPTDDDHQSEMVGDYYQFRKYLSHFTGSAGTLLVGQEDAYLWTDGRYFIQAEQELPENVKLMKMRQPNVPTIHDFLVSHLRTGDRLGFDGQVMNASFLIDLEEEMNIELVDTDMTFIWENRPERSHEKAFYYDDAYHGTDVKEKLSLLRDYMANVGATSHLIASLDDICWLFNIRGHDIACSPVVLSFALIEDDQATLYLQRDAYDDDMETFYNAKGVTIKDYDEIYHDVSLLEGQLLVDLSAINYKLYASISCEMYDSENPTQYFKCIKNDTEIKNTTHAHIKDGVAVTQFMYWLKHHKMTDEDTEVSIADKLESFRKKQSLYLEPSFDTICAYKENGAIIHYHATSDHCARVYNKGMLMIDSGGQYLDGTTDITRTFVLGELSEDERRDFTLVLKCFLNLMNLKFPHGMTGINIDTVARAPLWEYGMDFRHGTGHGVGHFLNVHEGPQGIRPYDEEPTTIEPGMITSDEPGYYKPDAYGIRHENLLLCVKDEETEYGQFLSFKPLTLVPIDLDGVDVSLLSPKQRTWLNDYHKKVYDTLHSFLNEDERAWLKEATKAI